LIAPPRIPRKEREKIASSKASVRFHKNQYFQKVPEGASIDRTGGHASAPNSPSPDGGEACVGIYNQTGANYV
jgi:hypothetical protein